MGKETENEELEKYEALMAAGRYSEALEVGAQYCDICGRFEVSDLISGASEELIKMTRHEEWCGLVVCEDCPGPEEGDE